MLDRDVGIGAWIQAKREALGLTESFLQELLGMPEAGSAGSWMELE